MTADKQQMNGFVSTFVKLSLQASATIFNPSPISEALWRSPSQMSHDIKTPSFTHRWKFPLLWKKVVIKPENSNGANLSSGQFQETRVSTKHLFLHEGDWNVSLIYFLQPSYTLGIRRRCVSERHALGFTNCLAEQHAFLIQTRSQTSTFFCLLSEL